MSKNLESKPIETLVTELVNGTLDVNELNISKKTQRNAFLLAVKERNALLSKVNKTNAEQFLKIAISENPSYFVQLTKEQYSDELAQLYLYKRLNHRPSHDENAVSSVDIIAQKSLDDKIILVCSYVTPADEALYYFDKELQVPVSLKSNIAVTLKLNNAVDLIDKLDVHITQLGEWKIKSIISSIIINQYKSYLNSFIVEKEIGYYTLCTSLYEVENGFKARLSEIFQPYGISINELVIKKIAIPKDIQNKIEDQAFEIRQKRASVEADAEFSKLSLQSYEAKLAILQKYPDAQETLTEYEKDLALKRYLIKTGNQTETNVDRTVRISHEAPKTDSTVKKMEDIIPDIPEKVNMFKRVFITTGIISLFITLIVLLSNTVAGAFLLGFAIFIFGIVAAFNLDKFTSNTVEVSEAPDSSNKKEDEGNAETEE